MVSKISNQPLPIARFITDVRQGIEYSSDNLDSVICLHCHFWLCRNCRYVHTTLHPQRLQVELHQWVASSSDFAPTATCTKCSKPALARLQCKSQECSQCLCLSCFENSIYLDKFLEEHFEKTPMHKEFLAIYPEEWYVTSAWKKEKKPPACKCLTYVLPPPYFFHTKPSTQRACTKFLVTCLFLSDWPFTQIRILHVSEGEHLYAAQV